MRDAIIYAYKVGIRNWRLAFIVYFIQLCLSLTLGMQIYEVLKASIGNSLEINKLLANYDHTVFTDFLKIHGSSITPLIGELRWLILVWLLFSIFIDGGLLFCASQPKQSSPRSFWEGGSTYFFPFLKTSLLFLAMGLIWTILIFLPLVTFFEPSLEYFSSEKYTVWLVLLLIALWLIGFARLFIWSILSRLQHVTNGGSILLSIKNGWKILQRNQTRFHGLLSVFIGLHVILLTIYLSLEFSIGMTSPILICLFFLLQQSFVFLRILIRLMMYAAVSQIS